MLNNKRAQTDLTVVIVAIFIAIFVIAFIALCMWVFPIYGVWHAEMEGKAEFAQADQNRQISVLEATAKKESAVQLAQAEIERAKGVAEANKIIATSITEPYLRYLWITEVSANEQGKTVVYVPTESNIPILEANRLVQ